MRKLVIIPNKKSKYFFFINNIKNYNLKSIEFVKEKKIKTKKFDRYDIVIFEKLNIKILRKLHEKKIICISIDNHKKLNKYIDIFLDPSLDDNDKMILKNPIKKSPSILIEKIASIEEYKYVLNIFSILNWDSKFWKKKIAYIGSTRLTENILYRVNIYSKKWMIDMIQFLSNCHDAKTVNLAEKNKFGFKDIRITLEKKINQNLSSSENLKDINFRVAKISDFNYLKEIIKNSYLDSRYYFDNFFSVQKTKDFYSGWLKKGILGKFDDLCYVMCFKKIPVGFCTCKINNKNNKKAASIGLFGISNKYRGKGFSKLLLNFVESKLLEKKKINLSVVTQGRNYTAIRAYNNFGFSLKKTELWYHKWLT